MLYAAAKPNYSAVELVRIPAVGAGLSAADRVVEATVLPVLGPVQLVARVGVVPAPDNSQMGPGGAVDG